MKSKLPDIKWHDMTLMSVEFLAASFQVSIKTSTHFHILRFITKGEVRMDFSENWGPSIQIQSFSFNSGVMDLKVQSGATMIVSNCELIESLLLKI